MNSELLQAEVMVREAARLLADTEDRSFDGLVSDLMAVACTLEIVNLSEPVPGEAA